MGRWGRFQPSLTLLGIGCRDRSRKSYTWMALLRFGVAGVLMSGLTFYGTDPTNIKTVNGITGSLRFGGINDGGIMSVDGVVRINNKGRSSGAYRASVLGSFEKILDGGQPYGLNQDSDFAIQTFGQSKLAYNGSTALSIPKQVLLITDLIPDTDPMKSTLVNVNNVFWVTAIGDRNLTGFGQLAGNVLIGNEYIGVVLTPYVPVP